MITLNEIAELLDEEISSAYINRKGSNDWIREVAFKCTDRLAKLSIISDPNSDRNFILEALQAYWIQSIKELSKDNLGDIERKNWDDIKNKCSTLINTMKT